jgi:hypothetical protein
VSKLKAGVRQKKMMFRSEADARDHTERFNAQAVGVHREFVACRPRIIRITRRNLLFLGFFNEMKNQ